MKPSEIISTVIELAEIAKATRPKMDYSKYITGPNCPIVIPMSAITPKTEDTPDEKRLRDFLNSLSAAMIYMILHVMYIGRGDFGTKDLMDAYTHLSEVHEKHKYAIDTIMGKTPLVKYLRDGMKRLKRGKVNIDTVYGS